MKLNFKLLEAYFYMRSFQNATDVWPIIDPGLSLELPLSTAAVFFCFSSSPAQHCFKRHIGHSSTGR
jgi:hypothetical protein